MDIIAAWMMGLAIAHTFLAKKFHELGNRYPEGTVGENFFHLLGEVEIVFGLWSALFLAAMAWKVGPSQALNYLETRNFTEPVFVFAILTICSTRPVLEMAEGVITLFSRAIPGPRQTAFFLSATIVGPLLGSLITEPAAMTVTALILLERFFKKNVSQAFRYAMLGLLFVNVSIGGTLTHFAAPPVLMVAEKWSWDTAFMFEHFGWKGALSCLLSSLLIAFVFRKQLSKITWSESKSSKQMRIPAWIHVMHLLFLAAIVLSSHHPVLVAGLFLFFLGFVQVTQEYQEPPRLREGLLVAFFLGGLVILGGMQGWWLEPILHKLSALPLYLSAIGLTAVTDNAALTYLGTLVPNLSDVSKYALVSGAVVGGGLTVIANAPNPAGYSILSQSFGKDGVSPLWLFVAALLPTMTAGLCFWLL